MPLILPRQRMRSIFAVVLATGLVASQSIAQTAPETYMEFGTVVALGKKDVSIQTYDPNRGRAVQRSFALANAKVDPVRVGDTVEILYSPGGMNDASEYLLKRMIALGTTTLPRIGPAPGAAGVPRVTAAVDATPPPAVPERTNVAANKMSKGPTAKVPMATPTTGMRAASATTSTAKTTTAALGKGTVPVAVGSTKTVTLTGATAKAVPAVITVPMGASTEASGPKAPRLRTVAQDTPGEQCGRESDWQTHPISLAVLDFRYPTEHEEANDISKTGGGSGTAVADLVYNRLEAQPDFTLRRGDREKLYRMDFAGAARLGRQIGVDAVLLGTFAAVDTVSQDPDAPQQTTAYTLRAGIVETCTGQLLYKLTSITCPAGAPGKGPAPVCPGSQISVKDAINPQENAAAFKAPIDNLLGLLLQNGTPPGQIGTAGAVTAAGGTRITIRLREAGLVKVGDSVSIHAFRLAKNPTTSTLQRFEDTEIGRMTVQRVSGGMAEGTYQGDVPAKPGDTAEVVTE